MIRVAVAGATGYAGAELVRLLQKHPQCEITALSSVSFEGKSISEVYPSLSGFCDMICVSPDKLTDNADVIFAALPHGLSEQLAEKCVAKGIKLVDLGADFRLYDENDYKQWYGKPFDVPTIHSDAVYCIPELFRTRAANAKIIANPGCYPTSIALALYPALKGGFVKPDGIIADSKSGATGAGRALAASTHFCECNEAFAPYKAAAHRHTPEIEQSLSAAAGQKVTLTFVPHLLPINRGIISTVYARMTDAADFDKIYSYYEQAFAVEQFVRLRKKGEYANLRNVKYSNLCEISLHCDDRTGTLIAVSAIDNMVKGAAGQAIQNMNLMFGLNEQTGLDIIPPAF